MTSWVVQGGFAMRQGRTVILIVVVPLAVGATACTSTRTIRQPTVTMTARSTVTATVTSTATATRATTVTVAPTSPRPAVVVGEILDSSGTRLTAPLSPTVKTFQNNAANCYSLADPGFTAQCVQVHSQLGTAIGVVEINEVQERDLVYTTHGSTAALALGNVRAIPKSTEYSGTYYNPASCRISTGDIALDNAPKLVFYEPITSSEGYVDAFQSVDVVEASGQVLMHRDLSGGAASRAFGGGLEMWIPRGSAVEHEIVQWESDAWRVTTADVVSKDDIPSIRGTF
jgi:hypothetical protein